MLSVDKLNIIKNNISKDEYKEGLELSGKITDNEKTGDIPENRIVKSNRALRNKLLENNSNSYVNWLFEFYYIY